MPSADVSHLLRLICRCLLGGNGEHSCANRLLRETAQRFLNLLRTAVTLSENKLDKSRCRCTVARYRSEGLLAAAGVKNSKKS